MKKTSLVFVGLLLLVGCTPKQTAPEQIGQPEPRAQLVVPENIAESSSSATVFYSGEHVRQARSSSAVSSVTAAQTAKAEGRYAAYTDGVIGNGKPAVLFFHASWCPYCIESDGILEREYQAGAASVDTYKIDYDNSAALKERFGIVVQNTFVVIDGQGNVLKTIVSPTEAGLKELVEA